MRFEYVSWTHFARLCGILYRRIAASGYRPDLIVAITRGGYPPARVLADCFGIMNLVTLKIEHYHGPDRMPSAVVRYPLPVDPRGHQVLVVDDVSDSGDTFAAAFRHLRERGEPLALRTAVLHHKQTSSMTPDYHAQRIVKWRWITYPWAVVEDLTAFTADMEHPPASIEALREALDQAAGPQLPARVFDEVAPIVLDRVNEIRLTRGPAAGVKA